MSTTPRNAKFEGLIVEVYNTFQQASDNKLVNMCNCWHPDLGTFIAYESELSFTSDPFFQVESAGLIPVEKALTYINVLHHGFHAFTSSDGLVFIGQVGYSPRYADLHGIPCEDDDQWCEEATTFPIIMGHVNKRALRAHMGY